MVPLYAIETKERRIKKLLYSVRKYTTEQIKSIRRILKEGGYLKPIQPRG